MSIHNDDRQYGTEEEHREWEQELKSEYRKQEMSDELVEHYSKLAEHYNKNIGGGNKS